MSYRIHYQISVSLFPDGVGPLELRNGSVLTLDGHQDVVSTGATPNAISGANLTTAMTALAAAASAKLNTPNNLTQIQNFATGGN